MKHYRCLGLFLLCGVILVGLILRAWGLWYGLPHIYFPDEAFVINQALAMGYEQTLKPQNYNYPTCLMYALGILYGMYYVALVLLGAVESTYNFGIAVLRDPTALYLIGRITSVLSSVGSIIVVYCVGKRLFDRTAGLVAASAISCMFMLIHISHFVKVENLLMLLTISAFACGVKAGSSGKKFDYGAAGLLVGFAAATKYNGGLVIFPILLLAARTPGWQKKCINSLLVILLAMFGFFLMMPYAFIDFWRFTSLMVSMKYYSVFSVPPIGQCAGIGARLKEAFSEIGVGLSIFYILGLLYVLRLNFRTFVLSIFPVVHFILFYSIAPSPKIYLQVPIFPFLALLGGALFSGIWQYWKGWRSRFILILVLLMVLLEPCVDAVRYDSRLCHPDTRTLALRWIQENIPPHSVLVTDHGQLLPSMAPPIRQTPSSIQRNYLSKDTYRGLPIEGKIKYFQLLQVANVEPMYEVYPIVHDFSGGKVEMSERPPPMSLAWYKARGAQYVILTGFEDTYRRHEVQAQFGDYTRSYVRFYDAVMREGSLLAEFLPQVGFGPRIRIYDIRHELPTQES